MTPDEFIRSIYLGDRACKAVLVDTWRRRIAIQINVISRIRPGDEAWNFYTDEDITDGLLVFSGVRSLVFDPPGPIPNDLINDLVVRQSSGNPSLYVFELSIGSVDEQANSTEVTLSIEAGGIHLEDPLRPGVEIGGAQKL